MRRILSAAVLLTVLVLAVVAAARRPARVASVAAQHAAREQEPDSLAEALLAEAEALDPGRRGPSPFELLLRTDPDSALAYLRANGSNTDQRRRLIEAFLARGDEAHARLVLDLAPEGSLRDALRLTLAEQPASPDFDPLAFADSIGSAEYRLAAYLKVAGARPPLSAAALRRARDLAVTTPLPRATSEIGDGLGGPALQSDMRDRIAAAIHPPAVRAEILLGLAGQTRADAAGNLGSVLMATADSLTDEHDRLYTRMLAFHVLNEEDSARVATRAFVAWANGPVVSSAGQELRMLATHAGVVYPVSQLVVLDAVSGAPPQLVYEIAQTTMGRWTMGPDAALRIAKDSAVTVGWHAAGAWPAPLVDSMRAELLIAQSSSFPLDAVERSSALATERSRDRVRWYAASALLLEDSTGAREIAAGIRSQDLRDLFAARQAIFPQFRASVDPATIAGDTVRALTTVLLGGEDPEAESRVAAALSVLRMGWFQRLPGGMYGMRALENHTLEQAHRVLGGEALAEWARMHRVIERPAALRAVASVLTSGTMQSRGSRPVGTQR